MREICTSGLKRGAEPDGSAPTRLQKLVFCLFLVWPRNAAKNDQARDDFELARRATLVDSRSPYASTRRNCLKSPFEFRSLTRSRISDECSRAQTRTWRYGLRPVRVQTRRLWRPVSPGRHSGDFRHGDHRWLDVHFAQSAGDLWPDLCHRHAGQIPCRRVPARLGHRGCRKLAGVFHCASP